MAEGIESSSHWGVVRPEHGTLQSQLLTPWRAGQSSQTEDTELPEGQLFSLSSARLKKAHLKLTAEALGLPTGAGAEETRQLIEGHIISINREPGLVQVIVQERRRVMLGLKLYLVDQSGVFAEAHTEDFQDTAQSATVTSELEKLCEQLEKANCELERLQHQLHETVEAHERELEKERRHSKQLWRQMCDRAGIIVIRNGVRTRFMDQRQNGGVKYVLLPSGAYEPLRADFAQPSSYTSSKLTDSAFVSLCRIDLSTELQ